MMPPRGGFDPAATTEETIAAAIKRSPPRPMADESRQDAGTYYDNCRSSVAIDLPFLAKRVVNVITCAPYQYLLFCSPAEPPKDDGLWRRNPSALFASKPAFPAVRRKV